MSSIDVDNCICTEVRQSSKEGLLFAPLTSALSVCCFAFRDDFEHRNLRPKGDYDATDLFPMLPQGELCEESLYEICRWFWNNYGGFTCTLATGDKTCKTLEKKLHKDLGAVGSDIPPGYPNSKGEGMHRGNALN